MNSWIKSHIIHTKFNIQLNTIFTKITRDNRDPYLHKYQDATTTRRFTLIAFSGNAMHASHSSLFNKGPNHCLSTSKWSSHSPLGPKKSPTCKYTITCSWISSKPQPINLKMKFTLTFRTEKESNTQISHNLFLDLIKISFPRNVKDSFFRRWSFTYPKLCRDKYILIVWRGKPILEADFGGMLC